MDASPVSSKTSRRSRYSLYQSDYETAGEESDNSLYYSVLEDDDTESDNKNKENSINPSNVVSTRRSLLAKCLQNQFNHSPLNQFNRRVLIDPLLQSTPSAITNKETDGAASSNFPKILESSMKIEPTKNLVSSLHLERLREVDQSENNSSNDAVTNVDIIINDDNDQSLNSTIVAISDNQARLTREETAGASIVGTSDSDGM